MNDTQTQDLAEAYSNIAKVYEDHINELPGYSLIRLDKAMSLIQFYMDSELADQYMRDEESE